MPTICQYFVGNQMPLVVISISIYTSTSGVTTDIVPCRNPKEPLPSEGACRDAAGCFGWEIFVGRNRVTSPNKHEPGAGVGRGGT